MEETSYQGRVWVLIGREGRSIEDIDTDQIYHNAFLHITELRQMGQHALGNLEGWKDFPQKCRPGDIVVAGRNFGAGSSRQQAVDCFLALGVRMILAPSFGAIYFRNAVNSGLPVLKICGLDGLVEKQKLETGDIIRVDFQSGQGLVLGKNAAFSIEPMSSVQHAIYRAGNLFNFGRKQDERC
jgi:3-isopropylmalate/(R)-2-methylmalate dehydratase small subunit